MKFEFPISSSSDPFSSRIFLIADDIRLKPPFFTPSFSTGKIFPLSELIETTVNPLPDFEQDKKTRINESTNNNFILFMTHPVY